jgi:myo-inositol 2-dehydrogenase/D-chiro-inositol 1-dehydrogenase
MNFLILGDGPEERAWAAAIARHPEHSLLAAYPGLEGLDDLSPTHPRPRDLDDALVLPGLEAVVVGGEPALRAEALRRVAAEGLTAICLHPPGPDSEAYYVVSMSRTETGAVLVPDLPQRLHPGVVLLRRALESNELEPELGAFRGLRYEATVEPASGDLTRHHFARAVDVVRSLVGEIEAVNATGDPPGDRPDESLVVQLRGAKARRAEIRLATGPATGEPSRIVLTGSEATLTLELDPGTAPEGRSRLLRRSTAGGVLVTELEPFDPHEAVLDALEAALAGRDVHPDLTDATRAMEITEGVARSLRRGRTVDLHYEEISEAGTFKSVMTSVGCLVLVAALFTVPLALAGPALGFGWTIYIAYLIPPALVGFVILQLLRFALKSPTSPGTRNVPATRAGNADPL